MNKITPLTSKDGKSEWPYKGKILIATIGCSCAGCEFGKEDDCQIILKQNNIPNCLWGFDSGIEILFIEKPAEK